MNPDCYQSKAFAQVERKRVWGRSWVAVGNVDDIRHPGDTLTAEVGGQPIFVTRDKQGGLNGFFNVCRHRGSKLVHKNGRYPVISCHYHRWGYSLKGKLLATPLWNTVEGGQKVDMKTGEKKDPKKKRNKNNKKQNTKTAKTYEKGERLQLLKEQIEQDVALIEEAERLAVSAPVEEEPNYETMYDLYCELDTDGDGTINIDEFEKALKNCGFHFSRQDTKEIYQKIDLDKSNTMEITEFKQLLESKADGGCDQMKSIREAFDTRHLKKFNKDDYTLFSFRVEEWGPLVFVNLDDDDFDRRVTD
jgi:phenylpropionate dioxygenase-like ring-hydroxylating dioxygenase large terminal subunit